MTTIENQIKAKASDLGFSFCGITNVETTPHINSYLEWINNGFHGQMRYLEEDYVKFGRLDPSSMLVGAKTAIVTGIHYSPILNNSNVNIASYAHYDDYHQVIRQKMQELLNWLQQNSASKFKNRIFVDSGPVMEKDFAIKAGLGSIGKNSLFYHLDYGSYVLLGVGFTNLALEIDEPNAIQDICRECEKCIHACPTGCITNQRVIDASECISYLTMEYKGIIPEDLTKKIGGWIFGCDICQKVCPLNEKLSSPKELKIFSVNKNILAVTDLVHEIQITEEEFKKRYENTALSRMPFESYLRNIIIAIGNAKSKELLSNLRYFQGMRNSEIIREHAAMAVEMIEREI